MNRRDLLKSAAKLGLLGAVVPFGLKPSSKPIYTKHPTQTLDEFNRMFKHYNVAQRFGDYSIHFTGLKQAMDHCALAGQWLGWPHSGLDRSRVKGMKYYCATVPFTWVGSYLPGDNFRIAYTLTKEDFVSNGGHDRALDMIDVSYDRLIDFMKRDGAF